MDEHKDASFSDVENEPTPYGFSDVPASRPAPLLGIPGKKKMVVLISAGIICVVVACAVVGYFIIKQHSTPQNSLVAPAEPSSSSVPIAPQAPTSIVISVQKTASGARLFVQWDDLPNGTLDINIFCSPTASGTYRLLGGIPVLSPVNGSGYLGISTCKENGYFYGTASGAGGSPLWTSSSTPPSDTPPSSGGEGSNGSTTGNNPPPENNGGANGTSTDSNSTSTDNGNGTQGNSTSSGQGSPSSPGDNFMVQHNNGRIQISWQSLPSSTYQLVISRSASDTDPWAAVITETNIVTDGPYSILIGDDTLGDSYYYKMDAYDASGTDIATFGPTLLAPL